MTTTATATRAYRANQPPRLDVTHAPCRSCGGSRIQVWTLSGAQPSERCLGRVRITVGQPCEECGGVAQ